VGAGERATAPGHPVVPREWYPYRDRFDPATWTLNANPIFQQSLSQNFRLVHPVDCKSQERHRISLPPHLIAVGPSLGFLDQIFPLWIFCFDPLVSNFFGARLAINNCVEDAAQIQNEVRLIVALREPRAVINFRHPFLEQISCTGLPHGVDVNR